jgi:histidinol-phosphate aminotransferase
MQIPDAGDQLRRGWSRRSLGRFAALLGAGAALPFYNESALAQFSALGRLPSGAVKINANENPLGPCPEAAEAIHRLVSEGGRYRYEEASDFVRTIAEVEGINPSMVQPHAGSSDPLHRAVLAFTSAQRPLVTAEPGYESAARAAEFIGAAVHKVPLTPAFAHDVKAMVAAAPGAGLYYICNPNNPTGTVTPRAGIEWLLANKPAGSVVLVDEAYIHFCEQPSVIDLAAAGKDVVVLRTFSKLYGLAGLRAGAAIGRPDLLAKIGSFGLGPLPVMGMVAATVSLKQPGLVAQRRKIVSDIREDVFLWMKTKGFDFIPSVSNKFMVDVGRPGGEVVRAMAAKNVYIGRVWPVWPTKVRVSIGTAAEMDVFKRVFAETVG